jgi:2-polyprenyl-3-methyl-5-hydroxy-6-metoxy-1,4-benzoquinol methylase
VLRSCLCTQEQFETPWFKKWIAELKREPFLRRKLWELCYIAQALNERGMLAPEKRGLGFGVGQEDLSALFASYGCCIVATDLDLKEAKKAGWVDDTHQHASDLTTLNKRGLCDPVKFKQLVSYRNVNMREIPLDLVEFDFLWSTCAFEHLGTIELGTQFVFRAMDCLRPGGVAVHTTEFNIPSNADTISEGGTVLFRRQDIEAIADHLTSKGHRIQLKLDLGSGPADHYVDVPPYGGESHLKFGIESYVTTGIGLIIEKAG